MCHKSHMTPDVKQQRNRTKDNKQLCETLCEGVAERFIQCVNVEGRRFGGFVYSVNEFCQYPSINLLPLKLKGFFAPLRIVKGCLALDTNERRTT
jgi:hypothetical protein